MNTTSPTKEEKSKKSKKQTSKYVSFHDRKSFKTMPVQSVMVCYRLKDPMLAESSIPMFAIILPDGSIHGELEAADETILDNKAIRKANKTHPLFDKEVMQKVYSTYGFTKRSYGFTKQ